MLLIHLKRKTIKKIKTIITLIIEHMCCCEEGEIVLEEIFSTAILVPLIAVGGKNLANHRKHFVFHPPQTNGEGGGTPTQPQVKGGQRNLKYKHFLNIFFSWFLGLWHQEVLWCQALLFSVATLWFGIVWLRMA